MSAALLTRLQIIDAIERLVSLLQGDEGRETQEDLVQELVKQHNMGNSSGTQVNGARAENGANEAEDGAGGDMDVMEV